MSNKTPAIKHLARSPKAMLEFQRTGRLPQGIRPQSPLIALFEKIGPGRLGHFVGITVGPDLGYMGSRTFHNAAQAYRWVKPDPEVFGHFPAESWRRKDFRSELYLEDLLAHVSSNPPAALLAQLRHLRRPVRAESQMSDQASADHTPGLMLPPPPRLW